MHCIRLGAIVRILVVVLGASLPVGQIVLLVVLVAGIRFPRLDAALPATTTTSTAPMARVLVDDVFGRVATTRSVRFLQPVLFVRLMRARARAGGWDKKRAKEKREKKMQFHPNAGCYVQW